MKRKNTTTTTTSNRTEIAILIDAIVEKECGILQKNSLPDE